jgi:hypothetical protein
MALKILEPPKQPETINAPEIEKGVGCNFSDYLLVPDRSSSPIFAAIP